jgi:6-phosphogluconate dehydrogenase
VEQGRAGQLPDRDLRRRSSPRRTTTAADVDKILDTAGQKGTGKWTAISALDLGMPVTLIGESVFARCLSALKDERVAASKVLNGPAKPKISVGEQEGVHRDVRRALYCSKMISYAQGYMLLRAAEKDQGWNLNMGGIALMWRGGCIIRSVFLGDIKKAFDKNPKLRTCCWTTSSRAR